MSRLAKWTGKTAAEIDEEMGTCKGLFSTLLRATELPELQLPAVDFRIPEPLPGERVVVWKGQFEKAAWRPLPASVGLSIEVALARRKGQCDDWRKAIVRCPPATHPTKWER